MKPKKKLCLVISLVMACVLSLQFATSAFARKSTWNLSYAPGRPSSENIMSWKEQVHTAKSTTTINVDKVGGGATIHATSNNGINAYFTKAGQAQTNAAVGVELVIDVRYSDPGSSKNTPSGTWVY